MPPPQTLRRTSSKRKTKRHSTVTLLLPYTFLCTIGPSVTAATSLFVVRYLMCRFLSRHSSSPPRPHDERCSQPNVEALTGSVMAGLATLDGIASFLSTSYVQKLSDRFGRRPLLVVLPGLAVVNTASMMVAYIINSTTLAWVLLLMNGLFISASTKSVFVPTLCVADIATEEESHFRAGISIHPRNPLPYYLALASQIGAAAYAFFVIPETIHAIHDDSDHAEPDGETQQRGGEEEESPEPEPETITERFVAPIKPLKLLLPHRDKEDGVFHWRLFLITISLLLTTAGTVFIATACLLFLSDKFNFDPEKNAWVLAYLTFSRFAYLTLLFPVILKFGRRAYGKWERRRSSDANGERTPLVKREEGVEDEANHFDVIMAFLSVGFDTISLVLVSISKSYQQVLGSFAVLALGAGDNPAFKSVFVSAVPPEHASEALAALDMVLSAAKLSSPPILGSLYAAFVEEGRPELLFLAAGGCCFVGFVVLGPLVFTGRK